MADGQLPFAFDDARRRARRARRAAGRRARRDADARAYAVNPAVHVALEASAGTGKTKVLVDRYVNLLRAGVEPRRVLAITFTRKAAAEMRARIVAELTRMARARADPGRRLEGAARPAERDRHQHHRRVLPVAARRVPARGRRRPRLQRGRRNRDAAAGRRGARPRAAHRPGAERPRRRRRAAVRPARRGPAAPGARAAARPATGRGGGPRPVPAPQRPTA